MQAALLHGMVCESNLWPILPKLNAAWLGQDHHCMSLWFVPDALPVAEQISPRMWSLWPLLYKAFNEWAMEYLDNILVPLNNFISKGTEVFLACKSPDYLAQVSVLAVFTFSLLYPSGLQLARWSMVSHCFNCKGTECKLLDAARTPAGYKLSQRYAKPVSNTTCCLHGHIAAVQQVWQSMTGGLWGLLVNLWLDRASHSSLSDVVGDKL